MKIKLIRKNSKDLILFLSGWGCDEHQFQNMIDSLTKYDLCLCWDYSDLDVNIPIDFSNYERIYLIAYSAGVFVANFVYSQIPNLYRKIAINGIPILFDTYYGLSTAVEDAFRNINLDNYIEFRRNYLVNSTEELKFFNEHSSLRTIESCLKELDALHVLSQRPCQLCKYDKIILGEKDKIFSYKKQCEYYKSNIITLKDCSHNVFYKFQSFESIISLVEK